MSVFKDKQKTKDGRQWRFKVYYHNEDNKLVPYTSKRYLLEKEAKAEERLFLMNRNNPVKKKFNIVADDYFKEAKTRIRESTYISYKLSYTTHIQPYFENKFIDEIKVADIENWKNKIKEKIKISSCNKVWVTFNEIFKFANKKYELNYNPIKLSGRFKETNDKVVATKEKLRYITYEQFNKFISYVDDSLWHCLFMTLYFTGMRKSEILALNWNDIDFSRKVIIVNKTISRSESERYKITKTKNCINREIIMSNILIEELKKYKEEVMKYRDFSNNWFVFGNGDRLCDSRVDRYKRIYFEKANMKDEMITIHEFRHSHVSLCINEYLKSGQTDSTKFFLMMSQRMGHSLAIMQNVYMHLFPSVQDKIVDLLNNLK